MIMHDAVSKNIKAERINGDILWREGMPNASVWGYWR